MKKQPKMFGIKKQKKAKPLKKMKNVFAEDDGLIPVNKKKKEPLINPMAAPPMPSNVSPMGTMKRPQAGSTMPPPKMKRPR